jgi:sugar lactone lactonase YvrE
MKRVILAMVIAAWLALFFAGVAQSQKIETVAGVRVVNNEKGGTWGSRPRLSLKLLRTFGDFDVEDEHLAFSLPSDAVLDAGGNFYVLDTNNQRIQKFGPDGKYLATIGRKGQGPGEFNYPQSFDIDAGGNLCVLEGMRKLVHVIGPDGKELKTVRFLNDMVMSIRCPGKDTLAGTVYPMFMQLAKEKQEKTKPKLIKVFDLDGKVKQALGDQLDYGDEMSTNSANICTFDADRNGNLYLTFVYQNRIEKYAPDGKLLWKADRPLNFSTEMIKKGKMEQSGQSMMMQSPEFNTVTSGVAADDKGRVWVITYLRQLKKEEQVSMMMTSDMGGNVSTKASGDQELPIKDALKLEVFDPTGLLLGSIPLDHFADHVRIVKDNLLLIDSERRAKVYHYKIIEN